MFARYVTAPRDGQANGYELVIGRSVLYFVGSSAQPSHSSHFLAGSIRVSVLSCSA